MRPHGRASVDPRSPRALGVCQRCGSLYNHDQLRWQYQWGGLRLINLRILVCQPCYDEPQIQLRTIILPADPQPIEFPVPEEYSTTDNPLSPIGFVARDNTTISPSTYGTCIGNLKAYAGLNGAFNSATTKPSWQSAAISVSVSSYQNFIGKYWNAGMTAATNPAGTFQAPLTYSVTSFSVFAPTDQPISRAGATGLQLQGSNDGFVWTVLYSTTTLGTNGEQIDSVSGNLTTGNYQYHQIAIQGDGSNQVAVAQVQFNVADTGQNEE
jgi:hypothetical protein